MLAVLSGLVVRIVIARSVKDVMSHGPLILASVMVSTTFPLLSSTSKCEAYVKVLRFQRGTNLAAAPLLRRNHRRAETQFKSRRVERSAPETGIFNCGTPSSNLVKLGT